MKKVLIVLFVLIISATCILCCSFNINNNFEFASAEVSSLVVGSYYKPSNSSYFSPSQSLSSTYDGDFVFTYNFTFIVNGVSFSSNNCHMTITQSGTWRTLAYYFYSGSSVANSTAYFYFRFFKQDTNYLVGVLSTRPDTSSSWTYSTFLDSRNNTFIDNPFYITFSSLSTNLISTRQTALLSDLAKLFDSYNPGTTISAGYYLFPSFDILYTELVDYPFTLNQNFEIIYNDFDKVSLSDGSQSMKMVSMSISRFAWAPSSYGLYVIGSDDPLANPFPLVYRFASPNKWQYDNNTPLPILHLSSAFTTSDPNVVLFFDACTLLNYDQVSSIYQSAYPYSVNYQNAYGQGYLDGYDDGIDTAIISDSVGGIISQIFSGLFGGILAIEIFPNFPLYIPILIVTVFGIISLILWLIRGK